MERMKKRAPTEAIGSILAGGWEGKMEILVKVTLVIRVLSATVASSLRRRPRHGRVAMGEIR
jgi:hypothetical protein